jgi:uncharacterized OsmC-like protein
MSSSQGGESAFVRRKTLSAHNAAAMRTVVDCGEYGQLTFNEPTAHGGTGQGPSPLQAVLAALCGCEAVTFRRTATERGFNYDDLDFDAAFTIDICGRQGDGSVRAHFQTVRVRAVVATAEPLEPLAEVSAETEARRPVMNLLIDAKLDVRIEWVGDGGGTRFRGRSEQIASGGAVRRLGDRRWAAALAPGCNAIKASYRASCSRCGWRGR